MRQDETRVAPPKHELKDWETPLSLYLESMVDSYDPRLRHEFTHNKNIYSYSFTNNSFYFTIIRSADPLVNGCGCRKKPYPGVPV